MTMAGCIALTEGSAEDLPDGCRLPPQDLLCEAFQRDISALTNQTIATTQSRSAVQYSFIKLRRIVDKGEGHGRINPKS